MKKIKNYGALIALIYSFFLSIAAHTGSHIPEDEMAAKSQIRPLSIESVERVSISLRPVDVRQSVVSDSEGALIPSYLKVDMEEKSKETQLNKESERLFLSRALATEKYRVLRN